MIFKSVLNLNQIRASIGDGHQFNSLLKNANSRGPEFLSEIFFFNSFAYLWMWQFVFLLSQIAPLLDKFKYQKSV